MMAKFWISLLICACWMLQSHASVVVVTPDKNSTVYYDSSENVTYSCVVEDGEPVWEITCLHSGCISLQLRTNDLKYESKDWLVVDVAENQSTLMVREEARRKGNMRIVCLSHSTDSTVLIPPISKDYCITTYGPLEDPSKLELTVGSNNRHFFRWISPRVPQDVILSCYVTAVNLSSGNTLINTSTTEQYVSVLNSSRLICSEVMLSVFCANEEDDRVRSNVSTKMENIPLSPDIGPLEQNFSVLVKLKEGLSLEIRTKVANVCSSSYPVISYTVNVVDDQGITNTVTFNSRDSDDRSDISFTLNSTNAPFLALNRVLNTSVTVCSNITCHTTHSFTSYVAEIQNLVIHFSDRNVVYVCDVLKSSQATGCLFNLTTASIDGKNNFEIFTLNITSESKSKCDNEYCTVSMCNTTESIPTNYLSINAYAITDNRTVSDFGQPVRLVNSTTDTDYSDCFEVEGSNTAAVVGGAVSGVLGLAVLLTVVLLIILLLVLKRKVLIPQSSDELEVECKYPAESDGDEETGSENREPQTISVQVTVIRASRNHKARIKLILDDKCRRKIGEEAMRLLY